jgi:ABC-type nitrate/sulfonate/bicarbonate transport system substrate-binding protein
VVAGSGFEEAALVVRAGIEPAEVRKVAVPLRGGMKDLTALGLLGDLGWEGAEQVRQPSGDGAIIALFGQGVDAASMVEPYATMMAELGVGRVVRRTGDLWPGAPGCCLTTTRAFRDRMPAAVAAVVRAFARGHDWVRDRPDEAAELGARYIGIHARFIRAALDAHPPRLDGIRNLEAMASVMAFMRRLGYTNGHGHECVDLEFLDQLRA